jgi:CHASE3 domain sensor protein
VAHEDIEHMPEFYVPYEQQTQAIIDHSRNLDTLRAKHPEAANQIDEVAKQNHMDVNDLAYLPLIARKHDLSMLISKRTGKIIQAISVDPW